MTVITPWPIRLDGLVVGTHAMGLAEVDGLEVSPDIRDAVVETEFMAGEIPEWDLYPRAHVRTLSIWIAGCDENGAITHPSKERGHIEENWRKLAKVINKQGAPIAYEQDVPTLAGGVEILTGNCRKNGEPRVGGSRGLRRVRLALRFPFPYLRGAQVVSNGNSGTFNLNTSASDAPIYDAIVTFKNGTDQRLTVNEGPLAGQYVQWIGASGAGGVTIDMGLHTVMQGGSDVKGGLRHNFGNWLTLPHGDATLSCTLTGAGTVDVSFYNARS